MDADSDEEASGDDYDGSRDEGWDPGADRAYWRRRFFILCAGVVALGVCAWMFPGAHQPSARTAAATRASVAALASRQALPPAAYGSAWPVPKAASGSVPPRPRPLPRHRPRHRRGSPTRRVTRRSQAPPITPSRRRQRPVSPRAPARPLTSCSACSPASRVTRRAPGRSSASTPSQPPPPRARCCTGRLRPGGRDAARSRGVGLGGLQARGGEAGPVHARRAASADAGLESRGRDAGGLRGLAAPRRRGNARRGCHERRPVQSRTHVQAREVSRGRRPSAPPARPLPR